jgi:hypothetical protein
MDRLMQRAKGISYRIWMAKQEYIDPEFFNTVSQFAHFGMMFTVTTIVVLLANAMNHMLRGMYLSFLLCLVYSVLHEFWWDPTHENKLTRGSDFEDFAFLMAGCSTAELLFYFLL